MVFSSDRGAVTAEFMLITPALILAVVSLLGLFPLALAAIKLEVLAMQLARAHGYGWEAIAPSGYHLEITEDGRYECLRLSTQGLKMESEYCVIPVG